MKTRFAFLLAAFVIAAFLIVPGVSAESPWQVHGTHYNLNIIAAPNNDKIVGDSDGHTLFVKENGKTKITMTQDGGGFLVTDRNGLDGFASFNIAPGYYNVYARGLGKPAKGDAPAYVDINAYGNFTDAAEGTTLEWLGYVNIARSTGKPQVLNINNLFWVDVQICTAAVEDPISGELVCTEMTTYKDTWVFDIPELLDYFWDYDNNGLKLLQVRFYECTYDVTGTAPDYCRWGDGKPIVSSKTVVTV